MNERAGIEYWILYLFCVLETGSHFFYIADNQQYAVFLSYEKTVHLERCYFCRKKNIQVETGSKAEVWLYEMKTGLLAGKAMLVLTLNAVFIW